MKKIDIKINNQTFTFICSARDTRTGFAHDCTLFINDNEITTSHCYYINRTWERWSYQSVCIESVNNLITDRRERLKNAFMDKNGYKKLTYKRKAIFDREIYGDDELNTLLSVKFKLDNNLY